MGSQFVCEGTSLTTSCSRHITSMHIGRFCKLRTASWDGWITWPIIVEETILSRNFGHHRTHRMLSLSVGVPRLVLGSEHLQGVSVTTVGDWGGRWVCWAMWHDGVVDVTDELC